jgi:hypothetical protein
MVVLCQTWHRQALPAQAQLRYLRQVQLCPFDPHFVGHLTNRAVGGYAHEAFHLGGRTRREWKSRLHGYRAKPSTMCGARLVFTGYGRVDKRRRGSHLWHDLDDAVQEVFVECCRQGGVLETAFDGRVPSFRALLYPGLCIPRPVGVGR